jgi:hypothetical protein
LSSKGPPALTRRSDRGLALIKSLKGLTPKPVRNLFDPGDEGDFLADFVSVQLCAAWLAGLRTLVHEGPARVFESEGDCARAVEAHAYKAGDVLVIRNEGPSAAPACRRCSG